MTHDDMQRILRAVVDGIRAVERESAKHGEIPVLDAATMREGLEALLRGDVVHEPDFEGHRARVEAIKQRWCLRVGGFAVSWSPSRCP